VAHTTSETNVVAVPRPVLAPLARAAIFPGREDKPGPGQSRSRAAVRQFGADLAALISRGCIS
jgi:hypothetical protein